MMTPFFISRRSGDRGSEEMMEHSSRRVLEEITGATGR